MKHARFFLLLLILALILCACGEAAAPTAPYTHSEGGYTLTVDPINHTITHKEDVYAYTVTGIGTGEVRYEIRYPNGAVYCYTETDTISYGAGYGEQDRSHYLSEDILIRAIPRSAASKPTENHGGSYRLLLIGIVMLIASAVSVSAPEWAFYHEFGWAVKNAEPTERYLSAARIVGIIGVVLGFVLIVVGVVIHFA